MPFSAPIEPITATDDELRAALDEAELPALLVALVHVTGDESLLRDDLRLDAMLIQAPQGGLTPEQQEAIRALALDALIRFRDGGCVVAPPPDHELLCRLMEFAVDGSGMEPYVPILEEELAITGEDRRAPQWHKDELAPGVPFSVAIIGAGMSGLLAAHRLQQAGVPFTIIEKNDDVGGTWYENTYPGCRVDNPNHLYSYSFAQQHDWPYHFSTQDVLHRYFARLRGRARPASPRPVRHRGAPRHVRRGPRRLDARAARRRRHEHARGERRDQRRRPAEPAEAPGHHGPRALRRPVVPLGPLGARRRPARQAGGGDRHRSQCRAVHPRDRAGGGRAAGVPAHPELAGSHARVPRRGAARPALPLHAPAVLQPVAPVLDLLEDGGRRAAERARRPGVGGAGRVRQRAQRAGPAAPRPVPPDGVRRSSRPPRQGRARLPGGGQAHHPGQRGVGGDVEAAERALDHGEDHRDHRAGRA